MKAESSTTPPETVDQVVCGIVMPISAIDGCTENHWTEVLDIHTEAIEAAGFTANLVSNANDVGIIQKAIVQNLYANPIVLCDVSGKNPNVMLELGMRLAFDRAVVIVKDDQTPYSFDTSPLEHITYPRDLRFSQINDFKRTLQEKLVKTLEASKKQDFSQFLKHFGQFQVAKIETKEVSTDTYIIEELKNLRLLLQNSISQLELRSPLNPLHVAQIVGSDSTLNRQATIMVSSLLSTTELTMRLSKVEGIREISVSQDKPGTYKIRVQFWNITAAINLIGLIKELPGTQLISDT
jgi:hypothetical protein